MLWWGLKRFLPSAALRVEFPGCQGTPGAAQSAESQRVARRWWSCRLLSQTQSSAPSLPAVLSPRESCWGTIPVSCGCWDCDSAELDKTRRDLRPFSRCASEECPDLPCWGTRYPSTKPSCIQSTNNIVIMTKTYCHHPQAPQAWSESQQNLTDFTCLGHKKMKLRQSAFLLPFQLPQRGLPMASVPLSVTALTFGDSIFHSLNKKVFHKPGPYFKNERNTKFSVFVLAQSSGHSAIKY